MFRNKSLLLFDLDGTLIDSAPDLALALNHMLRTLERDPVELNRVRDWIGNGARTLVIRALEAAHVHDADIDKALAIFMDHYAKNLAVNTVAFPGVVDTLAALSKSGYHMAVVTNKPHAFVAPILHSLGMEHHFECIVGGDSLPTKKPDPAMLLHACEQLNIGSEDAVMIGDSKNDILAAKAAAIPSIAVAYGYNYSEPVEHYGPDLLCRRFADIAEAFGVGHVR